uniref:Uncharacterized protein n=1 Tax=Oryza punctata TaxID=4537 RepID=A0A0E0L5K7_ORYPU
MESKKAAAKRHSGYTVGSPPKLAKQGDDTVESSAAEFAKHGDDTVESSAAEFAKQGDDTVGSSAAEFAKPVHLVAALWADKPSYSVFTVDAAAVAGGNNNEPARARTLGGLPRARHGMSFVAAHSEHGSWIVGIGGIGGNTILYDPTTPGTLPLEGPTLAYPKGEPILIWHGSKVYAISRRPMVHQKSNLDFPPWFESLSFEKGVPCIFDPDCPYWEWLLPSKPQSQILEAPADCQCADAAKDLHGAVQVKQEYQVYKFKGGSRFLASSHSHMPVVAALSMRPGHAMPELFEGKNKEPECRT